MEMEGWNNHNDDDNSVNTLMRLSGQEQQPQNQTMRPWSRTAAHNPPDNEECVSSDHMMDRERIAQQTIAAAVATSSRLPDPQRRRNRSSSLTIYNSNTNNHPRSQNVDYITTSRDQKIHRQLLQNKLIEPEFGNSNEFNTQYTRYHKKEKHQRQRQNQHQRQHQRQRQRCQHQQNPERKQTRRRKQRKKGNKRPGAFSFFENKSKPNIPWCPLPLLANKLKFVKPTQRRFLSSSLILPRTEVSENPHFNRNPGERIIRKRYNHQDSTSQAIATPMRVFTPPTQFKKIQAKANYAYHQTFDGTRKTDLAKKLRRLERRKMTDLAKKVIAEALLGEFDHISSASSNRQKHRQNILLFQTKKKGSQLQGKYLEPITTSVEFGDVRDCWMPPLFALKNRTMLQKGGFDKKQVNQGIRGAMKYREQSPTDPYLHYGPEPMPREYVSPRS